MVAFELCLRDKLKLWHILIFSFSLVVISVVGYSLFSEEILRLRVIDTFDFASDLSMQQRLKQLLLALTVIADSPILGNFAIHLKNGDHGDIPHNILAAWTVLGLPGFIILGCLVLYA